MIHGGEGASVQCEGTSRFLQRIDLLLAALLFYIALEKLPLYSSLWLDETLTYWIASGSAADAWRRAIQFQGQSPFYYEIAWGIVQMFPNSSDLMLRIFSVLCGAIALIGMRLFLPSHSMIPFPTTLIVACALATDSFQRAIISARPYALAIALATFSMYALHRWVKTEGRGALFSWALLTVLTIYAHYLFCIILVVQLTYLATQLPIRSKKLRKIGGVLLGIGVLLMAGLSQLLSLSTRAGSLQLVTTPSFSEICTAVFPLSLVVLVGMGGVLAVIWGGKISYGALSAPLFTLAALWSVVPVGVFAIVSYLSPTSLFISRYWSWQVGGVVLLVAVCVAALSTPRARRIASYTIVLGMLLRVAGQQWTIEGWREVAGIVKESPSVPVVLFSGLIESEDLTFYGQQEALPYLTAPLTRYGVAGTIHPVGLSERTFNRAPIPQQEFFLVAARGRRGQFVSPTSIIERLQGRGRSVSLVREEGLVYLYRVTETK